MSEPVKDKHGIRIFTDVARLDPYNEATLKRFSVSKIKLNREEIEVLSDRYYMQGLVFLETIQKLTCEENPDCKLISRLLRKAAVAFDESADIEETLKRDAK